MPPPLRPWVPFLGIALLLFLLLGTGGCLSRAGEAAEQGPETIRFAYWGAVYEVQVWEAMARRFHARQDRVRVKLEHSPQTGYHPKLLAMHVGRCAPDVMAVDDEPFPELADSSIFEDLGPWVARDPSVGPEQFYPQFLQAWVVQGKTYALPHDGHVLIIYYNKAHLRAAGLPEPPADWTWADYLRYARALTRDLDGDGRIDRFGVIRPYNLYHSLPWIWSAGGDEFDPALTHWAMNTPAGIRGIRFCYDIVHSYDIAPRMTDLPGMTPENMFLTGGVSMAIHGPWWLQMCRRAKGLEWDVQQLPLGPKGRATRTTCEGIAISRDSRHKAAAWEWLRFVLGEEGQETVAEFQRGMPSVRSVAERVFPDPRTPQHEERFLAAMAYARRQRVPVQYGANNTVITREWDLMLLGKRTPEQVAANTERDVNRIMREPR